MIVLPSHLLKIPDHNMILSQGNSSSRAVLKKKTHFILTVFWFFILFGTFAQEQKIADSLARIYQKVTLKDTARLALLFNLSFNEIRDLQQAVKYSEELIALSQQAGNEQYLRAGYFIKGTKKRLLGNLDEALDAFFRRR